MATPPVDLTRRNWGERLTGLINAGVPVKKVVQRAVPIAKQDIRGVKMGGQGMARDEAMLSLAAAIKGRPVLQPKEETSWSPDDIWGDVGKDIADLTWRGVPSLAKFVWNSPRHVAKTAEIMSKGTSPEDTAWLKKRGFEHNDPITDITDPSSWARQIRNVSKTPILGIIPGVHTAAGLTTGEGRGQLMHHPLSTALDVLPVAQAVSKGAGLASRVGAAEGSVAEAAIEGHPVKAAYRALPEATRAAIGGKTLNILRAMGMDPESSSMSRKLDIEHRYAKVELDTMTKAHEGVLQKIAALPDSERTLLSQEAALPDRFTPSAEHATLLEGVKKYGVDLAAADPRFTTVSRMTPDIPQKGMPDATGTPASELGFEGDIPRRTPQTPEEIAAEAETLAEHTRTKVPEYVRETERRAGERRGEARPGGRRAGEREPTTFREAELVDRAGGDRRVLDAAAEQYQRMNPERRQAVRRGENARVSPVDEARAAAAEAAGATELADALRGKHGTDSMPPANTPEGEAALNKLLAESSRQSAKAKGAPTQRMKKVDYVYGTDSPVVRAQRGLAAAEEKMAAVRKEAAVRLQGETAIEVTRRMKVMDQKSKSVQFAEKRVETARTAVADAQRKAETGRGKARTIDNKMTQLEKALKNLELRQRQAAEAGQRLTSPTNRNIEAQHKKVTRAQERLQAKKAAFDEEFAKNPPANMVPMLIRRALDKIEGRVRAQPWAIDAEGKPIAGGPEGTVATYVDGAVKQMERADLYQLVTPEEWQMVRREAMQGWQEVADQGYNPVWVHNVDVLDAGRPPSVKPIPNRNARVSQVKERVGDLTPKVEDIAVSMGRAAGEYVRERATLRYQADVLLPRDRSWGQIRDFLHKEVDLMRAKGKIPRGVDEAGALQIALNKHFSEWDPGAPFQSQRARISGTATVGETKHYIPRNIAKIADELIQPYQPKGIVKAAGATSRLYKTSIMAFSLKHMAHILFGGTVMMMMRGGIEEILSIPKAYEMVREGKMPLELNHHLDIDTPDQMFQVAAGNTMGRLYMESIGKVAKAKWKFDEVAANMQRSMTMLGEESRALKRGMTPEAAREAGLQHSYKTLVDIDGMNPLERNVLRQVLPFYAFMRHTLRYILTYPIDHPMRAAILSRISDIEQKDWNTGLPEAMQTLFFMGQPDAHGDITGVEMRQFNPFRDTGSYFTWAGFFKALHPAASLPFTLSGGDKFTGSSELYPDLTYDPQTGNLVAKRPKNAPWVAAQTIVPELGVLDYFGGITQDMRDLKARDPEAYKRRLWSMLFIPFEPKKVNVPKEAADIQRNILKIAQQDVSNSMRTGKTSALQKYPVLPYQGELVQPEPLTNVINYLSQIRPQVAPRSAIPSVKLSTLG